MLEERSDGLQRFEWTCPRTGCRKYILSWTDSGLQKLKGFHLDQHFKEDIQTAEDRLASAQRKFEATPPKTVEQLTKLHLTFQDVCFLKTRYIKIDENIEVEWL